MGTILLFKRDDLVGSVRRFGGNMGSFSGGFRLHTVLLDELAVGWAGYSGSRRHDVESSK